MRPKIILLAGRYVFSKMVTLVVVFCLAKFGLVFEIFVPPPIKFLSTCQKLGFDGEQSVGGT